MKHELQNPYDVIARRQAAFKRFAEAFEGEQASLAVREAFAELAQAYADNVSMHKEYTLGPQMAALLPTVELVLKAVQNVMHEEAKKGGGYDTSQDGDLLVEVKQVNAEIHAARVVGEVLLAEQSKSGNPRVVWPKTPHGIVVTNTSLYVRPDAATLADLENKNPFGGKSESESIKKIE